MTPDKIRTNQRIFEAAGAIVCSVLFGFILFVSNLDMNKSSVETGLWQFGGYVLLAASCYLGLCYVFDRVAVSASWDVRTNWLLISAAGTTLLLLVNVVPAYVSRDGYHVRAWNDAVAMMMLLWLILNVVTGVIMGTIYLTGLIVRSVADGWARRKVVP